MKICIIGAGTSGLPAIKACLEESLKPTCYETLEELDWHPFNIPNRPPKISPWSKELSSYSDFPAPQTFSPFLSEEVHNFYLRLYDREFGLNKKIEFGHTVTSVEPAEESGKWKVQVINNSTQTKSEKIFDGVLVCTGKKHQPLRPTFTNEQSFKGHIIHSHDYLGPTEYDGRQVLVVGTGNRGVQIAVELAGIAKRVYLSTRRGFWLIPRLGPLSRPLDHYYLSRWFNILYKFLGPSLMCRFAERWVMSRFDHNLYGLKPLHRINSQHLTINDELPIKLASGQVELKEQVSNFEENSVTFKDRDTRRIDDVIICTGYNIQFPFLAPNWFSLEENKLNLYKHVFSPLLPSTIAFIGLVNPEGPIGPIAELQARWAVGVFSKRLQLPATLKMWQEISDRMLSCALQYYPSPRHTLQINWIDYMDELAGLVGARPSFFQMLQTDPKFVLTLIFGPCVPYQYRLSGPWVWCGAKKAIEATEESIDCPLLYSRIVPTPPKSRHPDPINFGRVFMALLAIFLLYFFLMLYYT